MDPSGGSAGRRWRVLAAQAVALGVLAVLPSAVHAGTATSVVIHSDSDDPVGRGSVHLFHHGNASMKLESGRRRLDLALTGGTGAASLQMVFEAPPGRVLRRGVYTGAVATADPERGTRPGIDLLGLNIGCDSPGSRFEVKRLVRNRRGRVRRLWLLFQHHCSGDAAMFGEVRWRLPAPRRGPLVLPRILRWPPLDSGEAATTVPVWVLARAGGTRIARVSVVGPGGEAFPIRLDECSGRRLAPGAFCEVWLRHLPPGPGSRSAVVRVLDARRRLARARLEAFTHGGRTRALLHRDPYGPDGTVDWSFTRDSARISASGSRRLVTFSTRPDSGGLDAYFAPSRDGLLAPGSYLNAPPRDASSPLMSISPSGLECDQSTGDFNITDATFFRDGALRTFGVDFEQRCSDEEPPLRGTLEFRAGDRTPLPAWMR